MISSKPVFWVTSGLPTKRSQSATVIFEHKPHRKGKDRNSAGLFILRRTSNPWIGICSSAYVFENFRRSPLMIRSPRVPKGWSVVM